MSDRHFSNSTVRAEPDASPTTPPCARLPERGPVVALCETRARVRRLAVDVMIAHVFRCVAAEPVRDFGCVPLLRRQHEDN